MKTSQAELLVGLDGKLARVLEHWAAVDAVLPPAYPLVLLAGVDRAGFAELAGRLPVLRGAVRVREQEVVLARAGYERRKGVVHEWVRSIFQWVRAWMAGTEWVALARRVPGRGQSYQLWWEAAHDALSLWQAMDEDPPPIAAGWPMDLGRHRTVAEFEAVVTEFEAAHRGVGEAELDLKIARGALRSAQRSATALLMAYGHGVRARLGQKGALVRSIPRLWPKRVGSAQAGRQ